MNDILTKEIKLLALGIGFDLVGVTGVDWIEGVGEYYCAYLHYGLNAEMTYLRRNLDKRINPDKLVPGAKCIICVGASYYRNGDPYNAEAGGKVGRYAWGDDYHVVFKERLEALAEAMRDLLGREFAYRCFVDTAPVLEKALAARCGLGWMGKNTLLLNETYGSWVLLGEMFCDLELKKDKAAADKCGSCRRCVEACPTGALLEPYVLDARKCISYINQTRREKLGDQMLEGWAWGCDICQEACPYNQKPAAGRLPEFQRETFGPMHRKK